MKPQIVLMTLVSLVASSLLPSCAQRELPQVEPRIQAVAASISVDRMSASITDLVAFQTRFPHDKQLEVADYLYGRLSEQIERTEFHVYEYWGVDWKNVIGTLPGRTRPEEVIVVCAHLDSESEKKLAYAPGADDNASGCAAVLELSQILAGHSFERTIRFIIFSREENGQQGSKAYLRDLDTTTETIVAALNLDMIAYGGDDEVIDLVSRPPYEWLVDEIADLGQAYGIGTKKVIGDHCF